MDQEKLKPGADFANETILQETEEILTFFAHNNLIRDAKLRLEEHKLYVKRISKNIREVTN